MKTYTSYAALGMLGFLAALGGCSTDDTAADGGLMGDGAVATTPDASVGDETATPAVEASTNDGGVVTTDDGAVAEASTGGDGASCGNFSTGSSACDECVNTSCCTPAATCDLAGDAGVDSMGLSSCEQLVSCVEDLCAPGDAGDAGNLTDCEMTCNPSYDTATQANADALLTCVSTTCMTQCM
jgi:hypothetical protein